MQLIIKLDLPDDNGRTYKSLARDIKDAFDTYHDAVAMRMPVTPDDAGVITDRIGERVGVWDVYGVPVRIVHPDEER